MTRFFLIRHGQSTFNAAGRFQGCCDEPVLTPRGIAAAQAAGGYLLDASLHAVVASPLRRAAQTAELIHQQLARSRAPSLETDADLREIDLPLWERRPLTEVRDKSPDLYRAWRDHPQDFLMNGRRPVVDLFERAAALWPRLLARFAGHNVLLVTHGGAARALIATALGLPPQRFHSLQQSNCGITIVEFPGNDLTAARLAAVNVTDYLGERLPKVKDSKCGRRVVLVPAGDGDDSQRDRTAAILNAIRFDAVHAASAHAVAAASSLLRGAAHAGREIHLSETFPAPAAPPASFETVLWVAAAGPLRLSLAAVIGLPQPSVSRLRVVPFALAVVHQAAPAHPPVLQAMNLHDARRLQPGAGLDPS